MVNKGTLAVETAIISFKQTHLSWVSWHWSTTLLQFYYQIVSWHDFFLVWCYWYVHKRCSSVLQAYNLQIQYPIILISSNIRKQLSLKWFSIDSLHAYILHIIVAYVSVSTGLQFNFFFGSQLITHKSSNNKKIYFNKTDFHPLKPLRKEALIWSSIHGIETPKYHFTFFVKVVI